MSKVVVTLAASALADLEAIEGYYIEQQVTDVGIRLVAEIIEKIGLLENQPRLGRIVPEFDNQYLRELIHPPFRIIYRSHPERLEVIRIWRSERLLKLP